jgi:hypothetical protein
MAHQPIPIALVLGFPRPGFSWSRALIVIASLMAPAMAQQPEPARNPLPVDAGAFVREVIGNELNAQKNDRTRWSYHLYHEGERGNQDRQVIETARGNIARTMLQNGKPLDAADRARDDQRLRGLASDPAEQAHREKRERDDAQQAQDLLQSFPDAFLYQYDGEEDGLVRLAFTPNPKYTPPNRKLAVFHSLAGRLWADRSAMRLARIEGRLFEDVNFFLGLGHLDKGGTFKVVQKDVGEGHWEVVSMDINMRGRAVFFKNVNVRQKQTLDGFRRVGDDLTFMQAYEMLMKIEPPK